MVNPANVDFLVGIDRNPSSGQLYSVSDLDMSSHGTIPADHFSTFANIPYPVLLPVGSSQPSNQIKSPRKVRSLHVKSTENVVLPEMRVAVINDGRKWTRENSLVCFDKICDSNHTEVVNKQVEDPIDYCSRKIVHMFESGLSEFLSYEKKKRSVATQLTNADFTVPSHCSVSYFSIAEQSNPTKLSRHSMKKRRSRKSRSKVREKSQSIASSEAKRCHRNSLQSTNQSSLPTITLGWSQADAHEYKNNKVTVAGNVGPFLRDSSLPATIKFDLLHIIKCALSTIPHECNFNLDQEKDPILKAIRRSMISEFEKVLGGDGNCTSFDVEGVTILIPLSVGFHKDTNNCQRPGMQSVIQVNSMVPINYETVPGGSDSVFLKWLQSNGYHTSFPCSIILYSRKSVYSFASKLSEMIRLSKKDDLRLSVKWAFIDRVKSEVNYETNVWNNDHFCSDFIQKCSKDKQSGTRSFQGQMLRLTASYQKIVSETIDAI